MVTFVSTLVGRTSRDLAGVAAKCPGRSDGTTFVGFITLPARTIQNSHNSHFRARCLLSHPLVVIANLCYQTAFDYFAYFLVKTKQRPSNASSSTTLCRNQADERIHMKLCPMFGVAQTILNLSSYGNMIPRAEMAYP